MLLPKSFVSILITALLLNQVTARFNSALASSRYQIKGCNQSCGGVQIRYPFGIGRNCSINEYFEVKCNATSPLEPKPILNKFKWELLEIKEEVYKYSNPLDLSYSNPDDLSFGRMTVIIPTVNKTCIKRRNASIIGQWINSVNLSGSPFFYDVYQNVFVYVGCNGNASLYNNQGSVLARCSSDKIHCKCGPIDLDSDDPFLKRYSVEMNGKNKKGNSTCHTASLISRDFMQSDATAVESDVPLVLGWYVVKPPDASKYPKLASKLTRIGYITITVIVVVAVILSCCSVCCCWYYRVRKAGGETRLRTKYFNKRLAESPANRDVVDKIKLFTLKELKKATHNFSEDRVLGHGGQGVVYKGMVKNGQMVAVKKPKLFEEKQWKEFINELVLLSQVNHRSIVKILGCCLESKEPLLVYEFMPNGTLFQHINDASSESLLTWDMRVKIASEAADAIAYLHSSSTNPIYHRDIKSTNILLDENYRAKVSDFGISKVISIEQSHMTTRVQGTFGYLDPEYFHSSQFTEKSDVYSFGVVLVELLTGQPPIRWTSTIDDLEKSLVVYFISSMNNNALEEILDPRVVGESPKEHVAMLANLARQCLHSSGVARPSMKEVAIELERLRKKSYATPLKNWQSFEIENTSNSSTLEIDNAYYSCPTVCGFANENSHREERVQPLFFTS